jgi:hypothetical protein
MSPRRSTSAIAGRFDAGFSRLPCSPSLRRRALKAPWLRMLDPLLEDVERATAIQTSRDRMRARFERSMRS